MKSCPVCSLRYSNDSEVCLVDGTRLVRMQDPRIGTTVAGRYHIEAVLGEGGMATVYRARHKLVDRLCAIKIMNASLARDRVVRERFRREAKAAQKLAHPNIIEIFDHGETDDGTAYLVMELLRGLPLCDLINKGPMPLDRGLGIMVQMARALARAHDFEVVHRDLKPDNIFISVDPNTGGDLVKLLDFGIARSMQDSRITGVGEVFGTPQYMSPERITSIDAGPPADLYAFGIIIFEMMSGSLPFDAPDIPSFFVKHMKEPAPKLRTRAPDVPQALELLVDQLLEKDPAKRPVDAHQVHADLIALCGAVGVAPPPDPAMSIPAAIAAPTLPPAAIDAWARRTLVFEQMLARVYGSNRPAEMVEKLEQIKQYVQQIREIRKNAVAEQRKLDTIENQGRDGRQRFGFAMDSLGIDTSSAKNAVRTAHDALKDHATRVDEIRAAIKENHRKIVMWEGRSAGQEPYLQLAEAYRMAADLTERWYQARLEEKEFKQVVEDKEKAVNDLEFQIKELRTALSRFEQGTEADKHAQESIVMELNHQADLVEAELQQIATAFCNPLRAIPDLLPLFLELENAAAAQ